MLLNKIDEVPYDEYLRGLLGILDVSTYEKGDLESMIKDLVKTNNMDKCCQFYSKISDIPVKELSNSVLYYRVIKIKSSKQKKYIVQKIDKELYLSKKEELSTKIKQYDIIVEDFIKVFGIRKPSEIRALDSKNTKLSFSEKLPYLDNLISYNDLKVIYKEKLKDIRPYITNEVIYKVYFSKTNYLYVLVKNN